MTRAATCADPSSAPSVLIFFGVDLIRLDSALAAMNTPTIGPLRCIVFGTDLERLGDLAGRWDGIHELAIVRMPAIDDALLVVVPDILAREGFEPSEALLVHMASPGSAIPAGVASLRVEPGWSSRRLVSCIREQWPRNSPAGGANHEH